MSKPKSPLSLIKSEAEKEKALGIAKLIEKARNLSEGAQLLSFPWPTTLKKPKVPVGYGIKGGWARSGLAKALDSEFFNLTPRDTDLIYFNKKSRGEVIRVSNKIMQEDSRHGHHAEEVLDIESYFASRDFTVNQVLLRARTLYASAQAVEDVQIGRVTCLKVPDEALAMRGIRLIAEGGSEMESAHFLESIRDMKISKFTYELHLSRVKERGVSATHTFNRLVELLNLQII